MPDSKSVEEIEIEGIGEIASPAVVMKVSFFPRMKILCQFGRTAPALMLVVTCLVLAGCDRPNNGPGTSATARAVAEPTRVEVVPLTNMVLVKAGSFQRIRYPVTLTQDFWLGRYEVTQGEFERVMTNNHSHFQGDPTRPVEKVSFDDAVAYCAAVTRSEAEGGRLPSDWLYRLPTEAEWEYACRAGSTNLYSFGNNATNSEQFAWTLENGEGTSHPVGQKRPNAWGFYDMHGNVWEWCLDWFEPYPATSLTNPFGPAQGKYKVFRGGGWNNDINMARCSNRFMMSPTNGIHFVGFRMALARKRPS